MARNTTAMKRGWNYDSVNKRLMAMVDGQEAFRLDADAASGSSAAVYLRSNLTSATTQSSGTAYGARFRVNSTGAKTGGTINALGARMQVSATGTGTAFNAFSVYTAVGAYATGSVRGIYMYMDTFSTAPSDFVYGIDIGIVSPSATNTHFIRCYNHATTDAFSVFCLDNAADDLAAHLFYFGGEVKPVSAYTSGTTVVHRVSCKLADETCYLHLFSS